MENTNTTIHNLDCRECGRNADYLVAGREFCHDCGILWSNLDDWKNRESLAPKPAK